MSTTEDKRIESLIRDGQWTEERGSAGGDRFKAGDADHLTAEVMENDSGRRKSPKGACDRSMNLNASGKCGNKRCKMW